MSKLIASFTASLIKMFDFKTRSSRSEYWYAALGWIICGVVLSIFSGVISNIIGSGLITSLIAMCNLAFYLIMCIASISLCVRRLHDIGMTGWLYFISLTGIGNIALLIMFCMDSQSGYNKWGANPKGM